jgi:hypothetical protein
MTQQIKLIYKDIHEHYCSLELLQQLYDKGMRYREWTDGAFTLNSLAEKRFNDGDVSYLKDAVTYQIVIEWLRINHGIWILVLPQDRSGVDFRINESEYPSHALFFSIIKYEKNYSCKELINTSNDKGKLFLHFDTPQEAYSAAFDYILKELI